MHSRFSTNTFPSWPLAPVPAGSRTTERINTVTGNENWMRARGPIKTDIFGTDVEKVFPVCTPGASDSARFDEVLEPLHLAATACRTRC